MGADKIIIILTKYIGVSKLYIYSFHCTYMNIWNLITTAAYSVDLIYIHIDTLNMIYIFPK